MLLLQASGLVLTYEVRLSLSGESEVNSDGVIGCKLIIVGVLTTSSAGISSISVTSPQCPTVTRKNGAHVINRNDNETAGCMSIATQVTNPNGIRICGKCILECFLNLTLKIQLR